MEKKRILIITQEMQPYTVLSEISEIARKLPQYIQENGMEIRVLMPRFGTINERRHRLHEVVRLSGMNIIVADDDYPLIIKVASLPGARMQVYFLDNEDFFKRKTVFTTADGKPHADNEDRMVFFCKGAVETVKKFGWAPDIVHCHGWMTSLVPLYLKTAYKDEPIFKHSKVVYSMYPSTYEESFSSAFAEKASINELSTADLSEYVGDGGVTLHEGASKLSDAIVLASENLNGVADQMKDLGKPILEFPGKEEYLPAYLNFYQTLLAE